MYIGYRLFYDFQIGPVDITTPHARENSPNHILPAKGHRPRSTTESGPRRHISLDYPNLETGDSSSRRSVGINKHKIGSPDGQKKLPTIIKYSGQGKEVFLCGKKMN